MCIVPQRVHTKPYIMLKKDERHHNHIYTYRKCKFCPYYHLPVMISLKISIPTVSNLLHTKYVRSKSFSIGLLNPTYHRRINMIRFEYFEVHLHGNTLNKLIFHEDYPQCILYTYDHEPGNHRKIQMSHTHQSHSDFYVKFQNIGSGRVLST